MARLDAEGVGAVTFRTLAADLGVSPMALYGHVADKDDVLLALVDRLADRLVHPAPPADPSAAIRLRWQTLYEGLAEHPWLPEVLARRRLMARSVLGAVEDIHASLVRAGLTLEQAIRAYRIMWEFTLGALLVRAGTAVPDRLAPSVQAQLRGAPDPERYPTLAASAPTWRAIEGRDTYARDLAALLDGLLAGAADGENRPGSPNPMPG
ncbi:MAG: TetR/AcrR family transcriptional regulator C-terminal domain-containing protein [Actinomycetota bacterium]|nr:TetR/AcrR family transcriptional regulator C-terminal domain-containing protein [Actinomycetota bacterium]